MTIAGIFKNVANGLWLAGGIGAEAELGLGELFSVPGGPRQREALSPHSCNLEAAPCPSPCSISLPTRQYR